MTIEIRGVTHRFGDRIVLRGIDLVLAEHRVGVVGANGSGKSTLARLLNGLVVPTEGVVVVDALDTARDGPAVRRRVGFVLTDPDAQIVMPTVAEDVAATAKGTEQAGVVCYGALGVGDTKMKIHKAAVARLFESNDQVLDAEEVYALAQAF